MSVQDTALSRLEACRNLFLVKYEEAPEENDLQLVLAEGRAEPKPAVRLGGPWRGVIPDLAYPVRIREGYDAFKITFEHCICFSVTNESYALCSGTKKSGVRFCVYEDSEFLNYVARTTFASQVLPDDYVHYAVLCENHIVDVACQMEPKIENWTLTATEVSAIRLSVLYEK